MLTTARGVTLGLGKINLGQLENQARQRAAFSNLKRNSTVSEEPVKPRFMVKKHVDRKSKNFEQEK
ncbi:unnamed protein product [Enterobius vermicularis]|uniref:Uncharacterized protein n=1 Tax=Enterobius vermicularis TaxID=51028 RepID=A0A0N4VKF8_ENTVE|nr:unnamed protein product [Enterobius vermicularis]